MRVQTEEWQRFLPGVRMYKGKKTLFYNGENLWGTENNEYLLYDKKERGSWEVIIVLPRVEVIREGTFGALNIETIIMADTVQRIETVAFTYCWRLTSVKLSRSLEYIGQGAFQGCSSLPSIFVPPSCREIDIGAFYDCTKLIILNVSPQTVLGRGVIGETALKKASPFEINEDGSYDNSISENVNEWIRNINSDDDQYALHRACSSYNPLTDVLYQIVKRQWLRSFKKKNVLGITPLQYLEANPFAEDIDQSSLVKRYILEMMGETV